MSPLETCFLTTHLPNRCLLDYLDRANIGVLSRTSTLAKQNIYSSRNYRQFATAYFGTPSRIEAPSKKRERFEFWRDRPQSIERLSKKRRLATPTAPVQSKTGRLSFRNRNKELNTCFKKIDYWLLNQSSRVLNGYHQNTLKNVKPIIEDLRKGWKELERSQAPSNYSKAMLIHRRLVRIIDYLSFEKGDLLGQTKRWNCECTDIDVHQVHCEIEPAFSCPILESAQSLANQIGNTELGYIVGATTIKVAGEAINLSLYAKWGLYDFEKQFVCQRFPNPGPRFIRGHEVFLSLVDQEKKILYASLTISRRLSLTKEDTLRSFFRRSISANKLQSAPLQLTNAMISVPKIDPTSFDQISDRIAQIALEAFFLDPSPRLHMGYKFRPLHLRAPSRMKENTSSGAIEYENIQNGHLPKRLLAFSERSEMRIQLQSFREDNTWHSFEKLREGSPAKPGKISPIIQSRFVIPTFSAQEAMN